MGCDATERGWRMSQKTSSKPTAPYPGLRPFRQDEAKLFFGRDVQIDDVLARLKQHQFLGVVGTSGCGKSSLIRAGMLPALESGLMGELGSSWFIADMKPGDAPLTNLAKALMQSGVLGDRWSNTPEGIALLSAALRRSDVSLVNLIQQVELPKYTNLLVLADQFEEIFRFQQSDPNEALAFVNLLLATGHDRSVPIYVVLTMRSDYLGQCALFPGLPEALNDAQYLCPRLTRDQLAEAIEGPASVFVGEVERALVTQIVNDAGANSDQLPLVQHVLARMWHLNFGDGQHQHLKRTMRLHDYCKVGGLKGVAAQREALTDSRWLTGRGVIEFPIFQQLRELSASRGFTPNALSQHADEAYFDLQDDSPASADLGPDHKPSRKQRIAQMLFRCLAERGPSGQYVRRPVKVQDVAAVAGCSVGEVIEVVEVFRREDRSFLVPPVGVTLDAQSVLDISHEALIRQWQRFGGQSEQSDGADSSQSWLAIEDQSRRRYRRLAEAAENEKTAGMLRDPELGFLNQWWEEFRPTRAWADACVKLSYDRTEHFLNQSLAQAAEEAREKDTDQKIKIEEDARKRALTTLVAVSATGFVIAVILAGAAFYQRHLALLAADEARNYAAHASYQRKLAEDAAKQVVAAVETKQKALDQRNVAQEEAQRQEKRAEGYKLAYLESPGAPWPNGKTLRARFLDGNPETQAKVQKIAQEWTAYANLKLEFGASGDAEIRISFKEPGSWAYVGTKVLSAPKDGPTVNLGFVTRATPEEEISRYVLHEFGHVLGMIHEHQNPNARIHWNQKSVYDFFSGAPNFLARDMINSTILQQYTVEVLPHYKDKPFDPKSIMQYTFPASLTLDGTVFEQGSSLSDGDKEFARKLYPAEAEVK